MFKDPFADDAAAEDEKSKAAAAATAAAAAEKRGRIDREANMGTWCGPYVSSVIRVSRDAARVCRYSNPTPAAHAAAAGGGVGKYLPAKKSKADE